ncbi:zinc finger BED domain-containing protein RICESLEEPER 2-like [Canna indica]|uniref:Zinc finger BED domain-containing protein RICESLEEPER 2-like n=1 Tax=Canna indica TaxID=4628 RepID=A0AAQ3KXT2_9LILI|nr:zinc finger BED domain-containing protein RICESLEEPER 2-like [Canna indica]
MHLWRHSKICLQKRLHVASQLKQPTIPFQPSSLSINPFATPSARYSNVKMRQIIATAIMVHEHPFNIVEDEVWMWGFQVLSFVKVLAPRRGIDVADVIFKCLKTWGIEKKVFSVSVDNASYNDSCPRALKDSISDNSSLPAGGSLFHIRCCAHILNLLVQDDLGRIKDIIHNVRESVKYINYNDSRLKSFCDIVEQKHLKEKKLIIDCPTRWNSTYKMLSAALKFKTVFFAYRKESHTTKVDDSFMRNMTISMKEKFDKYWGECNMVMALASILDPRCKLYVINYCFPLIYKPDYVASENVDKVMNYLQLMYDEYANKYRGETTSSHEVDINGNNSSSNVTSSIVTGFNQIMSIVREKQAIPPMKLELKVYLGESVYIPEGSSNSFNVLEWCKNNSLKYKILSKMVANILVIPISIVVSESTFNAGEEL